MPDYLIIWHFHDSRLEMQLYTPYKIMEYKNAGNGAKGNKH
jgi:hypothetical protein